MSRGGANKCQAMKRQLLALEKSLQSVAYTFDRVEKRAQVLHKKLHDDKKLLRRDSYVLHLMELFIRHPGMARTLAQYVSLFFQLLLRHVESECPTEAPFACVRQIWLRERKNKAVRCSRMRFCQTYAMSSTMISALNEIHNCFCDTGVCPLTQITSLPLKVSSDEILSIIDNELPENVVAKALRQAIVATQMSPSEANKTNATHSTPSIHRNAKSLTEFRRN